MKNKNKGFVVAVLLMIIALLVIGGGIYVFENKKMETPVIIDNSMASSSIGVTSTNLGANNSAYSQIIYVGYTTKNIQTANLTAYLYSPTTGTNVAQFPLSNLGGEYWGTSSGQVSLNLSDQKNKGITIPSGQYKIFLCDSNISDLTQPEKSLCGSSQIFSIVSSNQTSILPVAKIICTLSGNTIDYGSSQNGLTFVAQGQNCASLSGWAPNNPTNQSLTFNGITKTWRMVLLSFYEAHFSPDGNHFAYTASNIPLPPVVPGGDWKPQRFVVSDNVAGPTYDDIYYPQYSQDGKHLGYCAMQNGQYLKIIDGILSQTTKDDYFATCDSLFGFKQEPQTGITTLTSPDSTYTIVPKSCARDGCSSSVTVTYSNGNSKLYGPYVGDNPGYFIFSKDSRHFAWLVGNSLYIDGRLGTYPINQKYNEVFNIAFGADSKSITYNARYQNTVYYVVEPIN